MFDCRLANDNVEGAGIGTGHHSNLPYVRSGAEDSLSPAIHPSSARTSMLMGKLLGNHLAPSLSCSAPIRNYDDVSFRSMR